jgi:hypothetical protein
VIVASTDNAVGLLEADPLAIVDETGFFFTVVGVMGFRFTVVVVFFASGEETASEELTQLTVTASANAGNTSNDLWIRVFTLIFLVGEMPHSPRF